MQSVRHRLMASLAALLMLSLLVGCSGKKAEKPAAKDEAPAATTPKGVPFEDPATGIALQVPKGWNATPGLNESIVAMISPLNGEEDLFQENAILFVDKQFKDPTMKSYLEALAAEVRKRYPDTKTLEEGDMPVNGVDAHWLVDSFSGPKGPMKVYRLVLVHKETAYVLHGTSPAQTFDRYRPNFEAIGKSLRLPQ